MVVTNFTESTEPNLDDLARSGADGDTGRARGTMAVVVVHIEIVQVGLSTLISQRDGLVRAIVNAIPPEFPTPGWHHVVPESVPHPTARGLQQVQVQVAMPAQLSIPVQVEEKIQGTTRGPNPVHEHQGA